MVITSAFTSELPLVFPGFQTLNILLPDIVQVRNIVCASPLYAHDSAWQVIPELIAASEYEKLEDLLRSFECLSASFLEPHLSAFLTMLMSVATAPLIPARLRPAALQPLIMLAEVSNNVCKTHLGRLSANQAPH